MLSEISSITNFLQTDRPKMTRGGHIVVIGCPHNTRKLMGVDWGDFSFSVYNFYSSFLSLIRLNTNQIDN